MLDVVLFLYVLLEDVRLFMNQFVVPRQEVLEFFCWFVEKKSESSSSFSRSALLLICCCLLVKNVRLLMHQLIPIGVKVLGRVLLKEI